MGEVTCPREVLEQLAAIQPVDEHDDNGPGRVVCPVCDAWMSMRWNTGKRIDNVSLMTHSDVCAAEWARAVLKPANVGGEARLAAHQPSQTTTATPQGVASTDELERR